MPETPVPEALGHYLEVTLHVPAKIVAFKHVASLPSFLSRMYSLHEGQIAGSPCVFLVSIENIATPSDIEKHVALVRSAAEGVVVFVADGLSAYNRSRLIGQGIPFVVPGKQLYIPDLAMDLRERFRKSRQRRQAGLSPAAQAVLFHRLLVRDESHRTPSALAARLHYSVMSVGRAFDELVNAGLARTERFGKERRIRFKADGRQLFDASHDLLRSPVRAEKYIRDLGLALPLKNAGHSALSELTDLSPPRLETLAVAARNWKTVARNYGIVETDRDEAVRIVHTWGYDPAVLSTAQTVDPLSLHVQFRDHPDERVSMAAKKLLEGMTW